MNRRDEKNLKETIKTIINEARVPWSEIEKRRKELPDRPLIDGSGAPTDSEGNRPWDPGFKIDYIPKLDSTQPFRKTPKPQGSGDQKMPHRVGVFGGLKTFDFTTPQSQSHFKSKKRFLLPRTNPNPYPSTAPKIPNYTIPQSNSVDKITPLNPSKIPNYTIPQSKQKKNSIMDLVGKRIRDTLKDRQL